MKELDLMKLPIGTKVYCTILGNSIIKSIDKHENTACPILITNGTISMWFTACGKLNPFNGECVIFPSEDNRDWTTSLSETTPELID